MAGWSLIDEITTSAPTPNFQHYSSIQGGVTLHSVIAFSGGTPSAIGMTAVPNGGSTQSQGTLTTVGAGTLTAALLLGGDILRSGPTGAFTDTTDTAALIQAAWSGGQSGVSSQLTYQNNTAFAATIAGGTGVTISGNPVVGPNQWARFLMVWAGVNTVTLYNISQGYLSPQQQTNYTSNSVTAGTVSSATLASALGNYWLQTGATPGNQQLPSAANLLAALENGKAGMSVNVRIINTGSGTLTVTQDAGTTVTLVGSMTVAQNTFRDFVLNFPTATTATLTSVGTGTTS